MSTAPCAMCGQLAPVDHGGIRCACTPARSAAEIRGAVRAAEARNRAGANRYRRARLL